MLTADAALTGGYHALSHRKCFTAAGSGLTFHGRTFERPAHRRRRMPSVRDMLTASRRDRSSRRRVQEHDAERAARGAKARPDHAAGAAAFWRTVAHEYRAHRIERVEAVAQKRGELGAARRVSRC